MDPAWRIEFDPAHHAAFEIIQPARERHVADRAPQIASPDRFQADLPASSATASCCSGFQRLCADTASGNTAIPNPPHAAFVACAALVWCRTRENRQDQPIFARNKGSSPVPGPASRPDDERGPACKSRPIAPPAGCVKPFARCPASCALRAWSRDARRGFPALTARQHRADHDRGEKSGSGPG